MSELDKPIGTKEAVKLSAGSAKVEIVEIVEKPTKKGGKVKLVSVGIRHPDKQEIVKISNMKFKKVQGNNETITTDGIWYGEDEDGNIDKRCNAASLMSFYKVSTLKGLVNTFITTELNNSGYLAIKTY